MKSNFQIPANENRAQTDMIAINSAGVQFGDTTTTGGTTTTSGDPTSGIPTTSTHLMLNNR